MKSPEDDARVLAAAEAVKADPARLAAARSAALRLEREAAQNRYSYRTIVRGERNTSENKVRPVA